MTLAELLAQDPLYGELGEIGRKQKSLEPTGLLSYEEVLSCPEVTRRSGPEATQFDLARHARQALLDAVASITDQRDNLIAEAALCTTELFIGKDVNQRKALLRKNGISSDMYKERRPYVLGCIINFLRSDAPDIPTSDPIVSLPRQAPLIVQDPPENVATILGFFTRRTFELHYRMLSYILVCKINEILDRDQNKLFRQALPSLPSYKNLLIAKAMFIVTSDFDFACRTFRSVCATWVTENMPSKQQRDLTFMMETIVKGILLNASQRSEVSQLISTRGWDETVYPRHKAIKELTSSWQGLFEEEKRARVDGTNVYFTRAEMFAAKSAVILSIIETTIGIDKDLVQEIEQRYQAEICLAYSHLNSQLAIDGIPLTSTISSYFGSARSELAQSPAAWVDCSSERYKDLLKWSSVSLFLKSTSVP